MQFLMTSAKWNAPKGCFKDANSQRVFFNAHATRGPVTNGERSSCVYDDDAVALFLPSIRRLFNASASSQTMTLPSRFVVGTSATMA